MKHKTTLKRISHARQLTKAGLIEPETQEEIETISRRYTIGITPHIQQTITNPSDPIARQYIPSANEAITLSQEQVDPIGDFEHTPVKGIVHRHYNRALFKVTSQCAVYCRFCFRREMVGQGEQPLSQTEAEQALSYIRMHSGIQEVILTGGDPFILSQRQLKPLLENLDNIAHIRIIRIHTRVPVADPARISGAICATLKPLKKALYIALHINHPDEITTAVKDSIARLHDAGCTLLSQSVLLKKINDSAETLERLYYDLLALNVKPYYIHHPDLAPGTSHFRLSLARGKEIMLDLQRRSSGLCQPHYMLDIPGGFGKIPINSDTIEPLGDGRYHVRDPNGKIHLYDDKLEAE